jgi:hypothetical protein
MGGERLVAQRVLRELFGATETARAAVDTILAQSRTSTRRLVPQLQHVRPR